MKNSTQIILSIVAIAAIIALVKGSKKSTTSNFSKDEKDRYCYRVNKGGNGYTKVRCTYNKF